MVERECKKSIIKLCFFLRLVNLDTSFTKTEYELPKELYIDLTKASCGFLVDIGTSSYSTFCLVMSSNLVDLYFFQLELKKRQLKFRIARNSENISWYLNS